MSVFVKDHHALKWRAGMVINEDDHLAVEEPLEIRLGGRRFTLTMRTPGHDEELAAGFLLAEGFINSREELGEIRRLRDSQGRPEPNALDVILNVPSAGLRERLQRNFSISSSCGVCGKTSIEALERRIARLTSGARIPVTALFEMPRLMRDAQAVFSATGGLHAAGLFEFDAALSQGSNVRLLVLREDVGRHNAVDKIIGYALLHDKVPLNYAALGGAERSRAHQRNEVERANESARCATEEESATCAYAPGEAERSRAHQRNEVERANESARCAIEEESATCAYAMMVSGRLSFEIVQKAAAAGVAILCAVSAPSSLAVELAEEVGMTLVGFLREPNLNIYTAEERIVC